jgi:hypothetical protein
MYHWVFKWKKYIWIHRMNEISTFSYLKMSNSFNDNVNFNELIWYINISLEIWRSLITKKRKAISIHFQIDKKYECNSLSHPDQGFGCLSFDRLCRRRCRRSCRRSCRLISGRNEFEFRRLSRSRSSHCHWHHCFPKLSKIRSIFNESVKNSVKFHRLFKKL